MKGDHTKEHVPQHGDEEGGEREVEGLLFSFEHFPEYFHEGKELRIADDEQDDGQENGREEAFPFFVEG